MWKIFAGAKAYEILLVAVSRRRLGEPHGEGFLRREHGPGRRTCCSVRAGAMASPAARPRLSGVFDPQQEQLKCVHSEKAGSLTNSNMKLTLF